MGLIFTIYGFGEVGSLLAALLNSNFTSCTFNLIDTAAKKNGKVLDFEHAATCRENIVLYNSKNTIPDSDFIIYAAGHSNLHGESRNSVASKNKKLVYDSFSEISFQKKTKIIVVTNPVEPVSYWLNDAVKGKVTVIGSGTSLDTFRFKFILSQHYSCKASAIETSVVGEHGQHMVPIFSKTFVDGINLTEISSPEVRKELIEELIQSAFKIRETEAVTKYGIAQTCLELIHGFSNKEEIILPLSIALPSSLQKEFSCTIPVFVSLPCSISSMGIHVSELHFSKDEKIAFQNAVNAIEKIIVETI